MNQTTYALNHVRSLYPNVEVLLDEPMSNHTSFKIGGMVKAIFMPKRAQELAEISRILSRNNVQPLIIGKGTNLLVDDKALDLIVIKTTGLNEITKISDNELIAGSGALLSKIALFAYENEMIGFEFAHGIPGTLGGAIVMNAGAFGGEMRDVIKASSAYNIAVGAYTVEGDEHAFAYRASRFTGVDKKSIVLSSIISLQKGYKEVIAAALEELAIRRAENQPLEMPSAGSSFKRPQTGYAASLIEQAGLKGYAVGGAAVSMKHAGFIVNHGGATFSDVIAVMEHIMKTVYKQFGIVLEPEVKVIRGQ